MSPISIKNFMTVSTYWDHLNIKVRIGSLLFDFLLNDNIVPRPLTYFQEKHNHAAYEIQVILSGSGNLILDEMEQKLESSTIHIIGPNIFHSIMTDPVQPVTRSTVRFTFRDTYENDHWYPSAETNQIKSALSGLTYCQLSNKARNENILQLIRQICSEIETPSLGSYTNVQSLFAQIVIAIVRMISLDREMSVEFPMPSKVKDDLRSNIIDGFFMSYRQNLTIEMLANQLSLSTKQVNRLIHKHFQTTFKQKLLNTRVEVAKDLLRTTDMSVERIAEEVGYTSENYFYQLFQQKTGMTPSEYRARIQNDSGVPHP